MTDQGAEENGMSALLNSTKTRGKSCDETLAENCRTLATAADVPGVEGRYGGEALDVVSPRAYEQSCGHDSPKMLENPAAFQGTPHAAEPRAHGPEEIRHPAGGKPAKRSSLGFLVVHRGKDRHQTPKFAVCYGLGSRHRDQEVPSAFCGLWSQIELPALHR